MKEEIEKKIEEFISTILEKDTISYEDYKILAEQWMRIDQKETSRKLKALSEVF